MAAPLLSGSVAGIRCSSKAPGFSCVYCQVTCRGQLLLLKLYVCSLVIVQPAGAEQVYLSVWLQVGWKAGRPSECNQAGAVLLVVTGNCTQL